MPYGGSDPWGARVLSRSGPGARRSPGAGSGPKRRYLVDVEPSHSFSWRALGYRLWWSRRDWSPATRALLNIRVVALRVITIVPIILWWGRTRRRRFDIDRRGGLDDYWGVGIGGPIRSPE